MKESITKIPKGYEIDKDKSTFERIVFKPVKPALPKKWEDLNIVKGFYICSDSKINAVSNHLSAKNSLNRNTFLTKEQAEASIALAQLSQLREVYRQGWGPDYTNISQNKWTISCNSGWLMVEKFLILGHFLSFPTREIAQEFLDNFRDLIIQAQPLMS